MLDCKNEPCQPFKAGAPKIIDNLCEPCAEHFAAVKRMLDDLGIAYELDPTLVRGLDYYTRTAFEFEPKVEGSQSVDRRRRTLRRPHRAARRQADARHRLRLRHRAPHPQPQAPGARPDGAELRPTLTSPSPTPRRRRRALRLAHDLRAAGLDCDQRRRSQPAGPSYATPTRSRRATRWCSAPRSWRPSSVSLRDLTRRSRSAWRWPTWPARLRR